MCSHCSKKHSRLNLKGKSTFFFLAEKLPFRQFFWTPLSLRREWVSIAFTLPQMVFGLRKVESLPSTQRLLDYMPCTFSLTGCRKKKTNIVALQTIWT